MGLKTVLCRVRFGANMTRISRKSTKMAAGNMIPHSTSPTDDLGADSAPPSLQVQRVHQLHILGYVYHKTSVGFGRFTKYKSNCGMSFYLHFIVVIQSHVILQTVFGCVLFATQGTDMTRSIKHMPALDVILHPTFTLYYFSTESAFPSVVVQIFHVFRNVLKNANNWPGRMLILHIEQ